ncbi:MAG: hypothetical protein WCH11_05455 [Bdellovibrio sp.]
MEHIWILLLSFSWAATDFELPKPSDYEVSSYWEYGFGIAGLSGSLKYSDVLPNSASGTVTRSYSGFGPQLEVRRGLSIDQSAFFELGSRLSYFLPRSAEYSDTQRNTRSLPSIDHTSVEILLGGGYVLTYIPLRWYIHIFGQSLKSTLDSGFGNIKNGSRMGLGYYFDLSHSLNLEISNVTNEISYQNNSSEFKTAPYNVSMISLTYTINSPLTESNEPWKRKYQRLPQGFSQGLSQDLSENSPGAQPELPSQPSDSNLNPVEEETF